MKKKFAFFDFDKTVIAEDSIFTLYHKTMREKKGEYNGIFPQVIKAFFSKKPKENMKNEMLNMLACYGEEELREFVRVDLLTNLIYREAREEILRLHEEGYYLILVSASAEDYLRYVGDFLPFDAIIGSPTDENYNMVGGNNQGERKVERIYAYLKERDLEIDYEKSRAYSDSYAADGPMLKLVKQRYLINDEKKRAGYQNLRWHREGE